MDTGDSAEDRTDLVAGEEEGSLRGSTLKTQATGWKNLTLPSELPNRVPRSATPTATPVMESLGDGSDLWKAIKALAFTMGISAHNQPQDQKGGN